MAKSLHEVMIEKSEEGLMNYLDDFNKYTAEAIIAAVEELKKRGKNFSDSELDDIEIKIKARKEAELDEEGLFISNSWKKDIVTDLEAPLLYSKGAIRFLSILFSVIFGAVLLSINIKNKKGKWIVISFGIIYSAITIVIVNLLPQNTFGVLVLNLAGGLGLTTTFWDKFVGKGTKYRAKPIWIPLLISLIITIPIIFLLIYNP